MKSTVLIIGQNIERQIIDLGDDNILFDEQGRANLDIIFDERPLQIDGFRRYFSQIGILERVLRLLDFKPIIAERGREFSVRGVLKSGENYKILKTKQFDDFLWEKPDQTPHAIVLLESASLSTVILTEIAQYLTKNPKIKFIIEYRSEFTKSSLGQNLLDRADLVWFDFASHQTGVAEDLIHKFDYKSQLLLVNHYSGLSLSNRYQTYKLTNPNYLDLKPIEWLAIAVKVLNYQFDIEDRLELIARVGESVARSSQPNIGLDITKLSYENPNIELIRGQLDNVKIASSQVRRLSNSKKIALDLSGQDLPTTQNIMQVKDVPKKANLLIISTDNYRELIRYNLSTLDQLSKKLAMGISIPVKLKKVSIIDEPFMSIEKLDVQLNQAEFLQASLAKISVPFILDRSTPSDRTILLNTHIMADFANKAIVRKITPVIELQNHVRANFDERPGSIALEQVRIIRTLDASLKNLGLSLNQILLWIKLPLPYGETLDQITTKNWIEAIYRELDKHNLPTAGLKFVAPIGASDLKDLHNSENNIVICGNNFIPLTNRKLAKDDFRIKFSQLLADFETEN